MSLTDCEVDRACRIALLTNEFIEAGVVSVRLTHEYNDPALSLAEMRPAVSRILDTRIEDAAEHFRSQPGWEACEAFHIRLSEAAVAKRMAMAVLFPDHDEE